MRSSLVYFTLFFIKIAVESCRLTSTTGSIRMQNFDGIVIGSGIGGLVAGALLADSGKQVMILESHTLAGGAAQGFSRQGFDFDSGPSFYCGLSDPQGLNPLQQVLTRLGESLATVVYDPLGHYHFPEGSLAVYGHSERYRKAIAQFTPQGAIEFAQFEQRLLKIYQGLKEIPAIELRADWKVIPKLITNYGFSLLKLLPREWVMGITDLIGFHGFHGF